MNDLLYVPTDEEIDGMTVMGDQTTQKNAFKSFIDQDDYLSSKRGEYTKRYGALSPWYSNWDLRVLQEIGVSAGNKFQISLDLLNIGNLLSSSWEVRQRASNTGLTQPLAVNVTDGNPEYTFDSSREQTYFNDFGLNSRW